MASPLTLPSSGAAIVCVGFMGAGKSTAARSAAQALGIEAVDDPTWVCQELPALMLVTTWSRLY